MRNLTKHPPYNAVLGQEIMPGANLNGNDLVKYLQQDKIIEPYLHSAGTCKMGDDSNPDAVVDPRLRVRGVSKLRVVDGSVLLRPPTGNIHGTILMVAEKGSDMIVEDNKMPL